ncbi:uncharacterized protein LOC134245466 [Saccostrea cucullata]|uniref:uncharacterized protein LOC134245466 n=1 Tax=Saccostrea cuccullata TaxID=36930 RepID=UPI002ED67AB3
MATRKLGSPQKNTEICKTHNAPADVICEDCDKFICGRCTKTDHRDHDWKTLLAAASERRSSLMKFLKKIKEENLCKIEKKIEAVSKQIDHHDVKSTLNKTKNEISETVKFIEENNIIMSNYSLIDAHRELTKLMPDPVVDLKNCEHSIRFCIGKFVDKELENMVGKTVDLDMINHGNNTIYSMSPLGVRSSRVIETDPQVPVGICHSIDGGLLVTFTDHELDSHSKSLVRHFTATGEVINEYEYQEDGQTRMLACPTKITQNRRGDICVVNYTSGDTGNIVIISPSGRMKSVYCGHNLTKNFVPRDVVCDSLCNFLVTGINNNQIHLLGPDGKFLKFLLTDNEVNQPYSLSLHKSTPWVGYSSGLVSVSVQNINEIGIRLNYFTYNS